MLLQTIQSTIDWLAARGVDATVDDGPDAVNEQLNFSASFGRVVFVPSSGPMQVIAPTHIGEDDTGRRQLVNMMAAYDVVVTAYDDSAPTRRVVQQNAAVNLFESVVQALQQAYPGGHVWTSVSWVQPRKNLAHGAALAAQLVLNLPLFSIADPIATPVPVPDPKT